MDSFKKQQTVKTTLDGETPPQQQRTNSPGCSENIGRKEEEHKKSYMNKETNNFQFTLKETIRNIQQRDYSYSYGRQEIIDLLRTLRKYKQNMPKNIRKDAQYLLDLIRAKIQTFSHSNIVYRQLLEESYKLSQVLFYGGNIKKIKVREHETDTIYKHYIQAIKTKPFRNTNFFIRGNDNIREDLGTKIANTPAIFQSLKWREIMELTKSAIQKANLQEARPDNAQILKIKSKMEYSHNIHKQHPICLGCLGCTSHFIKNWNIYEPTVQKTKLVIFGRVLDLINGNNKEQFQKIKRELKKQISGLINCGGGIILFDCEKKYLDVYAKGYEISKNQAQTIINTIQRLLKQIKPQPKMEQNVFVSFVPVSKEPISQSEVDVQKNKKQNKKQCRAYVTRIVVRPTIKQSYTYEHNGKTFKSLRYKSLFKDDQSFNEIEQILKNDDQSLKETEQVQKNVEAQVKVEDREYLFGLTSKNQKTQQKSQGSPDQDNEQYVVSDRQMEAWINSLLSAAYTDFDHPECSNPLHGSDIPLEMNEQQLPDNQSNIGIEQKYQFATAMVVKQENYDQFKKRLQDQNFKHHLQFPFLNSKIKGTNATVLLYHNITPAQLKTIITSSNNYQFNGRNTVTVTITTHLKLANRLNKNVLPEQQQRNLQLWVDSQFKDEHKCKIDIVPVKNENKETEYYLKVIGNKSLKKSTLFIYLVCNHFNERVQFREPTMF